MIEQYLTSRKQMFFILLITVTITSILVSKHLRYSTAIDRPKQSTENSTTSLSRITDYQRSIERIAGYRSVNYGGQTKYRWLFLTSLRQYHGMMDRHYFAQFYAAQRHPNIEAVLWGLGFQAFDPSLTLIDNIRNKYGSPSYFDVIFVIGGGFSTKDIRLASRYSPIMACEHECWGYRCLPPIIDHNVTIMLQAYAYEIDLYHKSFSYNRVMIHTPISAEPLVFYPPVVLKTDRPPTRDIDLLVVGARSSFVYPLRTRLAEMIQKGLIKNGHVQAHPGYAFLNNTLEQTEAQMHSYAALLRRAKIVIVDSARYRYALAKYMQVALSGCLIIGDIPAEREDEFRRFVVEISMDMTDTQILSIIDYWIKHDDERQMRAVIGQQIVLNKYTWDHNIDVSLQALIRYRQGEYGIYHPYPYSLKCAPFDNTYDGQPTANKWCRSGLIGMPNRILCECNESTSLNYMDEEPDLDHWRTLGVNVNVSNPHMYLIPSGLISYCDSYAIISDFVRRTRHGAVCRCQDAEKSWARSRVCHISNSILTIARHLAYRDKYKTKN